MLGNVVVDNISKVLSIVVIDVITFDLETAVAEA